MRKIDKVVLQETAYIAIWTLLLSVLMQAVFLIVGAWELSVLLGNLYSGVAVIFNFFMIGLTVQKAVTKEESDAKRFVKMSGTVRMLFLFVVTVVGVILKCFNTWSVVLPLVFPRIGVLFRPYFKLKVDLEADAMNTVHDNTDALDESLLSDEDTGSNEEPVNTEEGREGAADGK